MRSRRLGKTQTRLRVGVTFIATLLLAAICPAQAVIYPGLGGWSTGAWSTGQFGISMGTGGRALDGFDHYDTLATVSSSGWTGGSYHDVADGWDGPTGFYNVDARAYMLPGETKIWLLYIWAVPGSAPSDLSLAWESPVYSDPLVLAQLEYIQKPQGITRGPELWTVWTTPPSFVLPFYSASNGLTGYGFKFTLTMIPEPSSILALAGGIAGLGGLALRRTRR
ncbi:MAG: PEP-CTERM sorting domain-containing protein [Armatimonadetes bacterium]|nr:PEP-CTERM sorting domain-containing protein [Armatimonadota bacterium]